jgi:hypothetical protein
MPIRLFHKKRSPWKGLLGKLAGGLAATVVMTQFQNIWSEAAKLKLSRNETSSDNSSNNTEQKESATGQSAATFAFCGNTNHQSLAQNDRKVFRPTTETCSGNTPAKKHVDTSLA